MLHKINSQSLEDNHNKSDQNDNSYMVKLIWMLFFHQMFLIYLFPKRLLILLYFFALHVVCKIIFKQILYYKIKWNFVYRNCVIEYLNFPIKHVYSALYRMKTPITKVYHCMIPFKCTWNGKIIDMENKLVVARW